MVKDNSRAGIIAGGNWIIDHIKLIETYPQEERLANIQQEITSSGGAPYNVLMALHKMGVDIPLEGIGVVGDDENGRIILDQCKEISLDITQLKMLKDEATSYTDVMTVLSTGKRTFFHRRGANAQLDESHFDFSRTRAKIFHLGYLLLLDRLDIIDSEGNTAAAKVLRQARNAGLKTSVDVVSEQSDRFKTIIPSSLPFVDYLFINEFEVDMLSGIKVVTEEGYLNIENANQAAELIFGMGVHEWVIIHFTKGAYAVNKSGRSIFQKGIKVPSQMIKGTLGAGDAFAAGVLAGIHKNWTMEESLVAGVCVALSSLQDVTSIGSIGSIEECMKLGLGLGWDY